jgi:hypothetical protein
MQARKSNFWTGIKSCHEQVYRVDNNVDQARKVGRPSCAPMEPEAPDDGIGPRLGWGQDHGGKTMGARPWGQDHGGKTMGAGPWGQDHGGRTMVGSLGMWSARDVFGMFSCFLHDYGLEDSRKEICQSPARCILSL